jgi:hypothetical protein
MIIYLIPLARNVRSRNCGTVMRRYPRIDGPAVLPLLCLAPHGVFPASRITSRAVSSYLAFSTLPCTSLPKNRRCLFCDTFRHRSLATAVPACFTRHAAVWCSDFPLANQSGSPAIICHQRELITIRKAGKQDKIKKSDKFSWLPGFLIHFF